MQTESCKITSDKSKKASRLVEIIPNIKNIIFDFGGVLVDLDRERCLQSFDRLGIDARNYLGQYIQGGIFNRIETGEVNTSQFCDTVRDMSGQTMLSRTQICDAWNDFLVGIPTACLEALAALKKRYRLFLLSNTNAIHWEYSTEKFFVACGKTVEYYFENIFLSYKMGLVKPDPVIFRRVIEISGIIPAETLFIDDSIANCEAAKSVGLYTYNSHGGGDWIKFLTDNI